jgi:glyoxylate reductase
MKKVLISSDLPQIAAELLKKEGFELSAWHLERPMTQVELMAETKKNNALLSLITDTIDEIFLNECRHLDFISQCGAGYDNIDLKEATRLKIPVANTPDAMSQATADIAFGLMIAVSRKMFYLHKTIAKGEWGYFRPKANLGIELRNKTLGVFGMGRIGTEMAKRCVGAFNMKIIYYNRTANPLAEKMLDARFADFETLLKESDVISVHSVLSAETRGIFNKAVFNKMKPTAIFINTSRGAIHHELDLIEALENARIWGAGLDVTNPEPMQAGNPLLSMENVAVLPHVGSGTIEARNEMAKSAAENIIEFYKSGRVSNILNPESLKSGKLALD